MFEKREYQTRIVTKLVDMFSKHRHIMLESPVGSGKTYMGLKALSKLGGSVVWVTMRRNLLTQAEKTMIKMDLNLDIHFDTIFQKHYPKADMLLIDEAQHDATDSLNNVFEQVAPKRVLGLSGTPFRTDKMTLCYEKTVRDIGIQQLIRLGYLSKFEHLNIKNWKPENVAKHYLMDPKGYGQSVMYFRTYEECLKANSILVKNGIRSDIVTGNSDRDVQIAKFENLELDVLVNMMVLTEGFDAPQMQSIFVRDSSKLPTIQMAGRVLRTYTHCPVKKIVQSIETSFPFNKVASPIKSYTWDRNKWLSMTQENLDPIIYGVARYMASQPIVEPFKIEKFKLKRGKL